MRTDNHCLAAFQALLRRIEERTWGRINDLRVDITGDVVTVSGHTSSYYSKQLAVAAVRETLGNAAVIHLSIEVDVDAGTCGDENAPTSSSGDRRITTAVAERRVTPRLRAGG